MFVSCTLRWILKIATFVDIVCNSRRSKEMKMNLLTNFFSEKYKFFPFKKSYVEKNYLHLAKVTIFTLTLSIVTVWGGRVSVGLAKLIILVVSRKNV